MVEDLRAIADSAVKGSIAPGVAVLLRDGNAVRVLTVGTADMRRPLTARSPFAIAGTTQLLVATAALRLQDQGAVALDDTVQDWLPALLPARPKITIEQLLHHTSGLFEFTDVPEFLPGMQSPEQLVTAALERPLRFQPGSKIEGSNTGYLVLGMVLEEATGVALADLLDRHVFAPARMADTSLVTRYPTEAVRGYDLNDDVTLEPLAWAGAAGGVVSTLRDLDRFLQALLAGDLLRAETLELMLKTEEVTETDSFGLGVAEIELSCGTALGHSGGLPGITSEAWIMPQQHRSAIVLVNGDAASTPANPLLETALCG